MGFGETAGVRDKDENATDEDLMDQAKLNPDAFGVLYQRYVNDIRRFVQPRVGNDPDRVDDLTSQIFTKAFRAVPVYRAGSFRGWLYEIARNAITGDHRRHRSFLPLDRASAMESGDCSLDDHVVAEEARAQLLSILNYLSPSNRKIVTYRLLGLSTPEIARQMNMSVEAVKSAQYRAFAKIKDHLDTSPRKVRGQV